MSRFELREPETLFESGVALFAGGLVLGMALLVAGRLRGGAVRAGRRAEPPPRRGEVPAQRHHHVCCVSTR